MGTGEKHKFKCNNCHSDTLHDILYEKKDHGSEDYGDEDDNFSVQWGTTWRVIQCRGCESISMKMDAWNSEDTDTRGRPAVSTTYFPPRTFRALPAWIRDDVFDQNCPAEINRLMKELYVSLQNDCHAASTMLMRAIFEHMMISKVADNGSFIENLNKFESQGFIGKKQREVVESMLEAGHASIHRAFIPKKNDIVTLADILEGVLEVVYIQSPKADELTKRIPKRVRKDSSKGS